MRWGRQSEGGCTHPLVVVQKAVPQLQVEVERGAGRHAQHVEHLTTTTTMMMLSVATG